MDVTVELPAARRRAGLTQAALAERARTSQATISAYERGRKQPSIATLGRLLAATGSRLLVAPAAPALRPSNARHARTARELLDAIALAEALPTEHHPELRYPRLAARRVASDDAP